MNYVDYLRACRYSDSTAVSQFIAEYQRSPDVMFAFFEGGNDVSFYGNYLQSRFERWHDIRCGNKKGVLATLDRLEKTCRPLERCLFFVDRDYDDLLTGSAKSHQRLFTTIHYSLENYLVDEILLRRVWMDLFKLPIGNPEYGAMKEIFPKALDSFLAVIRPICACALSLRKQGISCSLQNLNLDTFLKFRADKGTFSFAKGFRLQTVCDTYCGRSGVKLDPKLVRAYVKSLRNLAPKRWVRGKWELWFFVKFIQWAHGNVSKVVKNHKFPPPLTDNNAVEFLAPRLLEPSDLKIFFAQI